MNKLYIRLLASSIVLFLITIFNCIYKFFNVYTIILFLLAYLLFNYYFIGYERNNKRYQKDIVIKILIMVIAYYIITYTLGFFFGFNKTGYSLKILSILKNILPVIITIPILELLRYIYVTKGYVYKSIMFVTLVNFVLLDITLLVGSISTLQFILVVLMPCISKNVLLLYFSSKVGYKPSILYRYLLELPIYFLPIFPTLGIYIDSLIQFIFPMIIFYLIYNDFRKTENEKILGKKDKNIKEKVSLLLLLIILLSMVLLTMGNFKYYIVTIGSNSMLPVITKGDIVVIERLNDTEKKELKVGDILAFKHDNIIIVHRIINIIEVNGENYYYTKGDNNNSQDGYPIRNTDIVGKDLVSIPYLGYPTIALFELINNKT